MIETMILIGVFIGIVYVDKVFKTKPIPVRRSSFVPTRITADGTIVCEKKINTWG